MPLDAEALTPPTPNGLTATTDKCTEIKARLERWTEQSGCSKNIPLIQWFILQRNRRSRRHVPQSYTDEPPNPENGTSYTYYLPVTGCESAVVLAASSNTATGRTYGDPTAPGSFAASAGTNSVDLTWSDASKESRYLIKRTSTTGDVEFEVSENATSYTDNSVNGCEQYTYQIYAGNKCTEQGSSGVKAINEPTAKLSPDLSAYIVEAYASKAYFPDKIMVNWTVQDDNIGLVDGFDVSRSVAGENDYELLGTVQGGSMYEDFTAVGGMMYEYKVTGKLDCEGDFLTSNAITTTGFRLPYGIVNGHVEYESGVAVQGVEVLAEKASGEVIGTSLQFDGTGSVTVSDHQKLKPASFIVAEAWVKPSSVAGTSEIINKQSGGDGYRLYQQDGDVVFELNIDGVMKSVTAPSALQTGIYTHVAGAFDATGLKVYINGAIPTVVTYMLTEAGINQLTDMGMEADIVAALYTIQDVEYASFPDFESALTTLLGEPQQQRNMPLLIPVAKQVEYVTGTKTDLTGTIHQSAADLTIGSGFTGNIDEIRLWNIAKDEAAIAFDYKRIVGNDALGIAGYWRCDENFGSTVYDVSKSGGNFHKNDGDFRRGSGFQRFHTIRYTARLDRRDQCQWRLYHSVCALLRYRRKLHPYPAL